MALGRLARFGKCGLEDPDAVNDEFEKELNREMVGFRQAFSSIP